MLPAHHQGQQQRDGALAEVAVEGDDPARADTGGRPGRRSSGPSAPAGRRSWTSRASPTRASRSPQRTHPLAAASRGSRDTPEVNDLPVTKSLSGRRKKSMTLATSAGWPSRWMAWRREQPVDLVPGDAADQVGLDRRRTHGVAGDPERGQLAGQDAGQRLDGALDAA